MSDTLWLVLGGIAGALVLALWTHGQQNFGWETAQDVVVGAMIGGIYTMTFTIPVVNVAWPFFPLPLHANEFQRAVLMAIISMVSVRAVKRILATVAPAYMDRLAGRAGLEGGVNGPAPPPAK